MQGSVLGSWSFKGLLSLRGHRIQEVKNHSNQLLEFEMFLQRTLAISGGSFGGTVCPVGGGLTI